MKRSLKLKRNHCGQFIINPPFGVTIRSLVCAFYETLYLPYPRKKHQRRGRRIYSLNAITIGKKHRYQQSDNNNNNKSNNKSNHSNNSNNNKQQSTNNNQPHPSQPRHQSTCATTEAMLGSKSMARHPQ